MTRKIKFANNATSNLASGISNSATTISLTPGTGAKFPSLSAGQFFMGTLVKSDGSTEVVKVTDRSTDTLTVERAAESVGGASTAYAFSAGDKFEARLTAGGLGNELDRLDGAAIISPLNKSADYTVTEADQTSLVRVDSSGGAKTITLPQISTLTDDFDVLISKVSSDANTVSVARSSTDTINGATTYNLVAQWQSVWLVADRSTNTWTAVSTSVAGVNAIVDAGTGSGSATITLSADPGSKNNVALFIGSVYQQKSTYSVSGTTLTAGAAIPSGVAWEAYYITPMQIGTPSDGTVGTQKIVDLAVTSGKLADAAIPEKISASTSKTTPVDDDTVGVVDSEDGGKLKKLSFANLKAWVKSFCLPLTGGQISGPLKGALGTAIASAATIDLSARAGGDVLHITGTTAITAVTLGAGDVVVAIADAALPITAGANLLIDGVASGATYTCAANDRIVFIGDSSSKVHVQIIPYAGGTRVLVSAAAATTSGTSVDITGVPSWASVIHIPIDAISTNGSSNVQVQVGSGGSVQTTGYSSQAQYVGSSGSLSSSSTTGFVISDANSTDVRRGVVTLARVSGNTWLSSHVVGVTGASTGSSTGGGNVSLSGSLDRIRMTTVNGTDLFDNGQFNFIAMG